MPYMPTMDRNQMMMCSLNSLVDPESIARVMDVFVESLDLKNMGFGKTEAAAEGRPLYLTGAFLKLYLYGNRKQIRSSRKLAEAKARLERYEGYRQYMEENGLSQISLTDPEARLMKSKNGFMVAYNVQTAVDSETHIIKDYQVTSHSTDQGLLESTLRGIKAANPEEIIEATADKGYIKGEDLVECLENEIVLHVILPDGQDTYELEVSYEEAEIDETDKRSRKVEEIKKCLHAGEIPKAYESVIEKLEVVEKRHLVPDE